MPKTVDVYGVQLTTMQEMLFSKYMANNNIAMNTKKPDERKKIVNDWLNSLTEYNEALNTIQ